MKKQSDFSRLMGYAGGHRFFTYASWVLSAISALVALVPFLYIWMILRDVLEAAPNYAQAVNIPRYGWMAVLFAAVSYLIYICALLCSHLAAFRVATNLRLAAVEHLAKRQAAQGYSGEHWCGGNLPRSPAARPVGCHGHPRGAAGAAACV